MYGDKITKSMAKAISETNRRREIQEKYNMENNIKPKSIIKGVREIIEATIVAEDDGDYGDDFSKEEIRSIIVGLETTMIQEAEQLNFEKAAEIRDKIIQLKKRLN